ncbi:cytidyltransferase [Synechococcus phage S-ShM2]|uniref:Cytidylyltransferase n=3 Tax=Ahtivirus sagseatwo TaxID=2734079 RepID=A0A1D7SI71_9CAUD|nr:cytidyltransferase [Synechococcus phage S-ShM2]AGH57272.1 hypothetical protein CPLG_00018 [Cyanophage S-SSM2]AOO13182.1 cytidylyltransferase [Cyanophage S-RIM14]ADO97683.1 cytitidyltransferase [Synechococcus phage S-ShM2]AOO13398.1 cytidylyltransferase [Cyanophage S-RIM14]AOO13614.1 cytidylyltransferase [Cyanophage S-RIM14]
MRKKKQSTRKLTKEQRERKFAHLLGNLYTLNMDSHDTWCDLLCDDDGNMYEHMMTKENYNKLDEDVYGFLHEEESEEPVEQVTQDPLIFG